MAAAPSFFGIREEDLRHQMQHHQPPPQPPPPTSTPSPPATAPAPPQPVPQKKKRNLPGTPNPDAEVIALSPKTLLATNRFICEVCNKGFQREQNLQLHRRGHNLPWKLRQKSSKEAVRQRVYLCPEPSCVHHDPSRALGDLTGIKKHFCRKHGEKKWKCDKCSKRYAVHSDLKAHSKVCGTREYRCDCGTLFSRRDSFITHRAFCDALAQESGRLPTAALGTMGSHLYGGAGGSSTMALGLSQVTTHLTNSLQDHTLPAAGDLIRLGAGGGTSSTSSFVPPPPSDVDSSSAPFFLGAGNQEFHVESHPHQPFHGLVQLPDLHNGTAPSSSVATTSPAAAAAFNLGFFPAGGGANPGGIGNSINSHHLLIHDQYGSSSIAGGATGKPPPAGLFLGNMMSDPMDPGVSTSVYGAASVRKGAERAAPPLPQMSATALLQKAAQMGSSTSSGGGPSSLLRGFGSSCSSPKAAATSSDFRSPGGFGGESMRAHKENEAYLQDLMDSLTSGGTGFFGAAGGSGGIAAFLSGGGGGGGGGHEQDAAFGGYNPSLMCNVDAEAKLHNNLSLTGAGNMGGSDRLTRDFLGVGGGMVRSMAGRDTSDQREAHRAVDMASVDTKPAAPPNVKHFAGGSLQ